MKIRIAIVIVLAALAYSLSSSLPAPEPTPEPTALDLRGAFSGPNASEDAVLVAAMADEIACAIEFDGRLEKPSLTTASQFDLLRTRTREFLCKGESIGDRNPRARQIIGDYLDEELGNDGGPVTDQQRQAWVSAYEQVARASRAAVQ